MDTSYFGKSVLATSAMTLMSFGQLTQATEPPNIVIIHADDLNNWLEDFDRHPQTITPNFNRLMETGINFTNAHANYPVCGPSRASMLTGLHAHRTGYYGYQQQRNDWRQFDKLSDAVTMMEHFYDNGFNVYGTGKVFHNGHEDWSVWKGDDPIGHFGYEPSFGPFAWDGSYDRGDYDHALGLPHPDVLPVDINEHPEFRSHWGQSIGPLSNIPSYPPNPETGAPGFDGWILYGEPWHYEDDDNRDLMPDELNAKYAARVLEQNHEKPFFLFVGLNRPHTPFHAPQKYFDMYPLEELQLPNVKENVLDDVPDMLWNPCQTASCGGFRSFRQALNHPRVDNMWLKHVQAYLANVTFVDDIVGDIMASVKGSRYADNTIVIITSDHGLHLGEKEYLRSKTTIWEESTHVPFIIWTSDLEHPGARITHPVSLIDLYPTIIDFAGLPAEPNINGNGVPLDGHSLRPFVENPDFSDWAGPDFALTSIASGEELEVNEPAIPARQFHSIRTERYRFSLMPNGDMELYDHENDPFEWTNLARVEGHEELLREFRRKLLDYVVRDRN